MIGLLVMVAQSYADSSARIPWNVAGWTIQEIAGVVTLLGILLTLFTRYIARPQLRKAVEEGIATERGIQAAIREKLPELGEIVGLKEAMNRLIEELAHQRSATRELVDTFTETIREELRELSGRIDEEAEKNEEHRERNRQNTEVLRTELERVTKIATLAAKTGENLSETLARSSERRRETDTP